jgi:hypothetical protein
MTRSLLCTAFVLSSIVGLELVNAAGAATIPTCQDVSAQGITDLAPTDIFLDRLQNGHIWVRITNHGPNVVQGRLAELIVVVDGGGLLTNCQLYVAPGQTQTLNTGIVINACDRTRDVTVTVRVPGMRDARPSNNTYRELVP